ncbi:hypothetical protein BpHYR1_029183 [Brachionus plicatilis]|uniref:Uncharacterized protein n=1 Tax=Brachionus plicatilis TaxID=10195 RepID=A0A3M7RLA5_BRAPC|nr:hypothetical protein BpHYR1_029183 [Brachionus plicatilis]
MNPTRNNASKMIFFLICFKNNKLIENYNNWLNDYNPIDSNINLNLNNDIFGSAYSALALPERDLDINNQDKDMHNDSSKEFFENASTKLNRTIQI